MIHADAKEDEELPSAGTHVHGPDCGHHDAAIPTPLEWLEAVGEMCHQARCRLSSNWEGGSSPSIYWKTVEIPRKVNRFRENQLEQ